MGKCVSKHPSTLTIALSEKDLAAANQIWSKFAESTEYIALKDEHGNQLCEYYYVSNKQEHNSNNNNNKKSKNNNSNNDNSSNGSNSNNTDRPQTVKNIVANVQQLKLNTEAVTATATAIGANVATTVTARSHKCHTENQQNGNVTQQQQNKQSRQCNQSKSQQQQCETAAANTVTTTTPAITRAAHFSRNVADVADFDDSATNQVTDNKRYDDDINAYNARLANDAKSCQQQQQQKQQQQYVKHCNIDDDDLSDSDSDFCHQKTSQHYLLAHLRRLRQGADNSVATDAAVDASNVSANSNNHDTYVAGHVAAVACTNKYCQCHQCISKKYNNNNNNNAKHCHSERAQIAGVKSQKTRKNIEQQLSTEQHKHQQKSKFIKKEQQQEESNVDKNHVEIMAAAVEDAKRTVLHCSEQQSLACLTEPTTHSGNKTLGQAESKKHAKKQGVGVGIETKGTAMSFGFRKKLNTTPKKFKKLLESATGMEGKKAKQDKCNNVTTSEATTATSETNMATHKAGTVIDEVDTTAQDDNGNAALLEKVHFEKMGAAAAAAQQHQQHQQQHQQQKHQHQQRAACNQAHRQATITDHQPHSQASLPGAGNRFGYRGTNLVRPASAGLTPRYQCADMQENMENNNNNCNGGGSSVGGGCGGNNYRCVLGADGQPKTLVSNLKRRSKSAHAGRTLTSADGDDDATSSGSATDASATRPKISHPKSITFNLSQNSTIEYQRRQFFQQPTGNATGRTNSAAVWPQQQQQQQYYLQQQTQPRNIINTGLHTNVIVRPTPRAPPAQYSKFTLQTVSLPKPEFPVAISLGASTPTTPGATFTPSPSSVNASHNTYTTPSQRIKDMQHPLTAVASASVTMNSAAAAAAHMDLKTAKQMANSTRRGFTGSREISADSGIASMDMALDSSTSSGGRTASPKRSRSRPRNLQMVMNGRHKFEVRDLDDPLSSESSSLVETLALPKLPTENQTAPLPLCGLVRSNTVLSRESYERSQTQLQVDMGKARSSNAIITRNSSEESEGVDEEKLFLDRSASEKGAKFKDINTCSSKTSSPGSSIMLSWCNAGESLAVKDCSSLSISSSEDSNKLQHEKDKQQIATQSKLKDNEPLEAAQPKRLSIDLNDDDMSMLNTDLQFSTISSITETLPASNAQNAADTTQLQIEVDLAELDKPDRPKSLYNTLNESKFAEMALAGSTYLLDDETSPTDSLVSSTESEEAASKQKKHKINEELQEKDIDEISPELEVSSPISPGTPTHASRSLSLSDCGNLIDDEIADQPALLFNSDAQELIDSVTSRKDKTDTPTLMEASCSMRSLKSQSKARSALQQAIELSLRTPLSLRKAVMERADSLDTLSPCESICSDDLMMDFDMHSSVDSIDRRSASLKSRSGSDLNKIDETELFSELERKGSDVMKELNTILRLHTNRNSEKDSVIAHLPARATRLLNRSRLQQQCPLNTNVAANADSDSSKSAHSLRRSAAASRASTASTASTHHSRASLHAHRDSHSSSDDLMLYDKSFRNAMIQDVLQFKKQLLRLRRILQETETLNPFENDNGQLFASCGLDSKLLDDIDLASLTSSTTDDPLLELSDLRRQGQVDDRDRTIRLQKNRIDDLETKSTRNATRSNEVATKECINIATQTERTRPLAIGAEGLSRSKPEYTSYTTHFPAASGTDTAATTTTTTIIQRQQQQHQQPTQQSTQQSAITANNSNNYSGASNCLQVAATNQARRHTIISTTLSNYNQQLALAPRRASIAWEKSTPAPTPTLTHTHNGLSSTAMPTTTSAAIANSNSNSNNSSTNHIYKPVKITLIGEPLKHWPPLWHDTHDTVTNGGSNNNSNNHQRALITKTTNGYVNGNNSNHDASADCQKRSHNCHMNGSYNGGDGGGGGGAGHSINKHSNNNNCNGNNAYQQQQQTHKSYNAPTKQPLQVYQQPSTASNGNFTPTVTIV